MSLQSKYICAGIAAAIERVSAATKGWSDETEYYGFDADRRGDAG